MIYQITNTSTSSRDSRNSEALIFTWLYTTYSEKLIHMKKTKEKNNHLDAELDNYLSQYLLQSYNRAYILLVVILVLVL